MRGFTRVRFAIQAIVIALVLAGVFVDGAMAADAPDAAPVQRESYLHWIARSSGVIGLVIFCLSMYFVATVTKLFMELREREAAPPALTEQFDLLVEHRDLRGAYRVAKESDSYLGRVLSVGISELPHGLADAREAMEQAAEAQTILLEKKISMLAVLGTLGPMIGLLGTLKGMIASFSVIAVSDVQLKASEVAGGISEALLLTFEGVALSVPAIYFFAVFRNRVATIASSTTLLADQMLRKIYRAAKGKPAAAPEAAPAAAWS